MKAAHAESEVLRRLGFFASGTWDSKMGSWGLKNEK